ncbi:MAG: alpha-L-rhamnosidase-related protein [Chitinophagaceae bacterium]
MLNSLLNSYKKRVVVLIMAAFALNNADAQRPVWQSDAYSFYPDRIVQKKYSAKALSSQEIVSDYSSPANEFKSPAISFKFSINGKDNEMTSGTDHHFNCETNSPYSETPLIVFGKPLKEKNPQPTGYLKPGSQLKIRLDMRSVMNEFKTKGFYTCFDGSRIYKEDFKGVYVAGSSAPLIWDFDNLVNHPELKLQDNDGDGIYEATLAMNVKEEEKRTLSHWKLEKDLSAFPRYQSSYPLPDALYNMALEEMVKAVEPDSTFRTGKEWAGVWTRDVSYSIILSMAHLQPEVARYSLMRKVNKKKKIIQDTGTGGAWPISTDRMIWAAAAWELYKVTGDNGWLKEAYTVIKNSIEDDLQNIYDKETGLVKGESSFLDWREQTYPKWMQPADIFESENLGTNAVHYQANTVASRMAALLNDQQAADKYKTIAGRIKKAINEKLWLPSQKYYAQYLYGRKNKLVSPRAEALGEALCVVFGIADEEKLKQLVAHTPVTPYGVSCIYPQIPNIPPYHNNAVWPFVQAYWLWAGAMAGNEESVMESISAIYRPAALFATNKENFVAENGDYSGTQINSSNMLWSLSGNISIVHRILFGIQFEEDKLVFRPFVPQALKGVRRLENFHYRKAVLNITIEGYGNEISSFMIDGKPVAAHEFPSNMEGLHQVSIVMTNRGSAPGSVNRQPVMFSPAAPKLMRKETVLFWPPVAGAVKYRLLMNGRLVQESAATEFKAKDKEYGEYQVIAVDKNGITSFASEPLELIPSSAISLYEIEDFAAPAAYPYKGFSGKGFVETGVKVNTVIQIPVSIKEEGDFAIDIRYANGNGPVNTENKCAVRNLRVDDGAKSAFVFPQRGKGEWSNWGWSNAVQVHLTKGEHVLTVEYLPANENMNEEVNQAMLDQLRIIKK